METICSNTVGLCHTEIKELFGEVTAENGRKKCSNDEKCSQNCILIYTEINITDWIKIHETFLPIGKDGKDKAMEIDGRN